MARDVASPTFRETSSRPSSAPPRERSRAPPPPAATLTDPSATTGYLPSTHQRAAAPVPSSAPLLLNPARIRRPAVPASLHPQSLRTAATSKRRSEDAPSRVALAGAHTTTHERQPSARARPHDVRNDLVQRTQRRPRLRGRYTCAAPSRDVALVAAPRRLLASCVAGTDSEALPPPSYLGPRRRRAFLCGLPGDACARSPVPIARARRQVRPTTTTPLRRLHAPPAARFKPTGSPSRVPPPPTSSTHATPSALVSPAARRRLHHARLSCRRRRSPEIAPARLSSLPSRPVANGLARAAAFAAASLQPPSSAAKSVPPRRRRRCRRPRPNSPDLPPFLRRRRRLRRCTSPRSRPAPPRFDSHPRAPLRPAAADAQIDSTRALRAIRQRPKPPS
ncbi:hypothetical protein B0H15DRAFT_1007304 [Mycena belliarum]|uniref:Uncharacterized protein n=1 Tax=Mycena belliarum TaxID=1033014 RepID=A0AAD6TQ08_9AGAR|nr:hypothetical protein B0H15DRAFT_1007304 [Mycena belliae]